MPSPEQLGGEHKRGEQEPKPYYRAARFRREEPAGRAYAKAQAAIFKADCDLSVYRVILDDLWHVAVLGEPPPPELERKLQRILSRGEPAALPDDVLKLLQERRARASQLGPWIERHYRPGRPL